MIRSLYRTSDGRIDTDLRPDGLAVALKDTDGLLWVDFSSESPDVCEPILRDTFGFHSLAVDDALEELHVPKVDDWGQYLYLTLHAVVFDQQDEDQDKPLDTLELDVFLGKNYLVTYQAQAIATVDRVWTACQRDERHLQRGAAYLLYKLADELVADYMPVIQEIDDAIDQIEDEVFSDPAPDVLKRLFTLKRALLRLRRIVAPQREVLSKMGRGDYYVIDAEYRVFFRDVYDHLVRLYDITDSLRDLVGSALDTYLSVVSNRMNEVMKVLTIIATIFIPLTFLAGVYGMNFQHMPELGWSWAYPVVWLVMLVVAALMVIYFRRRGWL